MADSMQQKKDHMMKQYMVQTPIDDIIFPSRNLVAFYM